MTRTPRPRRAPAGSGAERRPGRSRSAGRATTRTAWARAPPARGPRAGRARPAAGRSIHPPEAPVAALVILDRLEQVAAAEVRPQRGRDPQLGVGELPQHEVRE